jgi:hypothetical protein
MMKILPLCLMALLSFPSFAYSCGCGTLTNEGYFKEAYIVALVGITDLKDEGPAKGQKDRIDIRKKEARKVTYSKPGDGILEIATGKIITQWKGPKIKNVEIPTRLHSCSGGYSIGGMDLIFLKKDKDGKFWTHGCGDSVPLEVADEVIAWLNKNHPIAKK